MYTLRVLIQIGHFSLTSLICSCVQQNMALICSCSIAGHAIFSEKNLLLCTAVNISLSSNCAVPVHHCTSTCSLFQTNWIKLW